MAQIALLMAERELFERKLDGHEHPDFAAFTFVFARSEAKLLCCCFGRFPKDFRAVQDFYPFYVALFVDQCAHHDTAFETFFARLGWIFGRHDADGMRFVINFCIVEGFV